MKDRYLFKAKRKDDGEWVIGNRIDDGVTGQVFIHAVGNSVNESDKVGEEGCLQFVAFEVAPSTICQCAGLRDRNGKLIYENDIMKNKHNSYRVVWDNEEGSWMLELDSVSLYGLGKANSKKYEVIGNIFDNPELLGRNGE